MIAGSILKKAVACCSLDEDLTFLAKVRKDDLIRLIGRVQQHPRWLAFMRPANIGMGTGITINWRDIKICVYEAVTIHVEMIIDCLPLRQSILAGDIAYETPIQSWHDMLWAITEVLRGDRGQCRICTKAFDLWAGLRIVDDSEDDGLAVGEPACFYLGERKATSIAAAVAR